MKCNFSRQNCILIQALLKFVLECIIENKSILVQIMAWHQTGAKPLSAPIMTPFDDNSMCHWASKRCKKLIHFNSLWPSDTIWRHRAGSTLAQVMACCLMAPSHYLNQWWLIVSKVQWHSSEGNFTKDTSATELVWKINYLKFCSNPPGAYELKKSGCSFHSITSKLWWHT